MKVTGVDTFSGKKVEIEIKDPGDDFFTAMTGFDLSDQAIKRRIDKLDISAEGKSWLYRLSKATLRVGEFIIKVGKKILDVVFQIAREFRMAMIGTLFGLIAGALINSIPVLGVFLGPIVTPILMAIGFIGGTALDVNDKIIDKKIEKRIAEQDKVLQRRINEKLAEFAPLARA